MGIRLLTACVFCHHHMFSEPATILDSFSCLHCGLRYKRATHEPLGWIVKVEGHSGGLVNYSLLAPLIPPDADASAVSGFLVSAAIVALEKLPESVQELEKKWDLLT